MRRFVAGGLFRGRQVFGYPFRPALFHINQFFLRAVEADFEGVYLFPVQVKDIAQILNLAILMCDKRL